MLNWWIDELFLWYGWPTKGVKPYFQPGPLSEILTIANLRHAASRTWTCAEPEFRLCWMKLCSSDNHYTTNNHVIVIWKLYEEKLKLFTAFIICMRGRFSVTLILNSLKLSLSNWRLNHRILFIFVALWKQIWFLFEYYFPQKSHHI